MQFGPAQLESRRRGRPPRARAGAPAPSSSPSAKPPAQTTAAATPDAMQSWITAVDALRPAPPRPRDRAARGARASSGKHGRPATTRLPGVHRPDRSAIAELAEETDREAAEVSLAIRGPDHRDGARREQRRQLAERAAVRASPTTLPGRLSAFAEGAGAFGAVLALGGLLVEMARIGDERRVKRRGQPIETDRRPAPRAASRRRSSRRTARRQGSADRAARPC